MPMLFDRALFVWLVRMSTLFLHRVGCLNGKLPGCNISDLSSADGAYRNSVRNGSSFEADAYSNFFLDYLKLSLSLCA